MSSTEIAELGFLRLDARRRIPLFRQLYEQIRAAVLEGRLNANDRIPSSRDLVTQLGVSRTTVVSAIELLTSEGYLQTRRGRGTFVCGEIPDDLLVPEGSIKDAETIEQTAPCSLSDFGISAQAIDPSQWHHGVPVPFCPGEPALDAFPIDVWSKLVRRIWKTVSLKDLSYGEPAGYFPLRVQIAKYLGVHRGVNCDTSQVIIVNGTQQAIDVVARIALNQGDSVLFEDPGYVSARNTFEKHGAKVVSMPVDRDGARVRETTQRYPDARMAYVTPSHQYPMGVTLPIQRRLELVKWAESNNAIVLEDDYDSEYRYSGRPLPSLQGLSGKSQMIYVGSFSKVVFPALGLGYAIVPKSMVNAFENTLKLTSRPGSKIDQIVLSEFIREGHFVRHLRKMRSLHSRRRRVFVEAFQEHLSTKMSLVGNAAGLHCTALLNEKMGPDKKIAAELAQCGIIVRALSDYFSEATRDSLERNGLVFGFACCTPSRTRKRLKEVSTIASLVPCY
ncbi:MAG: PLP-dependent aminotransferase family protein [Planctomycetota bacterium]